MEIQRTKTKKKKKVKERHEEEEEDVEVDLSNLSIDIDFPNSSGESIPSQDSDSKNETVVEAEGTDTKMLAELNKLSNSNSETEVIDLVCEEKETEEAQETSSQTTPSAPAIHEEQKTSTISSPGVHTTIKYDKLLYPDLNEIKQAPVSLISEKILSPNHIQPLSPLQREQLYSNKQIRLMDMFEYEFNDKELKNNIAENHVLYQLLKKYSKSRAKLKLNLLNLNQYKKKCNMQYTNIWRIEHKIAFGSGYCKCGSSVRGHQDYEYAILDEEVLGELDKNLKELLQLSCFNYTKSSHDSELYKMQIEQMLRNMLAIQAFDNVLMDSPVALNEEIVYHDLQSKVSELRIYISILFKFLRELSPDKIFSNDVKQWITKLVSLQLRISTWQDHIFILYHILRCPVGVGNWAANLIQVPVTHRTNDELESPFTFPEFQHCVSMISALLLPVKDRSIFLEKMTKDLNSSIDAVEEEVWILVDSDGEEGSTPSGQCIGLKENDLVALFDQIPLEMIFRMMTQCQVKNGNYELNDNQITGHHIIKSITFASNFIGIIKSGLKTYDTERYKQFAKRLGRLIKHTVFYIADIIQLFRNSMTYKDPEDLMRIQVEFDELIIRSAHFIYESQKLSLFQYLVDFPYHLMASKSLWKLYYYLHVGEFSVEETDVSRLVLNDTLKFNDEMAIDDMYFLLQTFSQMALANDRNDWDLIQFITMDLLNIGFMNEMTRDHCYSTVKDLIFNLTSKYPDLITEVFNHLKINLKKVGGLSTYLCKALPISKWIPKTEDLEVLASWLLNFDFDSIESNTARLIFSFMNWNFDQNQQLFLPHDIHIRMAFLTCQVYIKHVGESIGSGVTETARQVSNVKKNQSKKEQFSIWCWSMVSVLHLHFMDLNQETINEMMNNPAVLYLIPEIETTQSIYQGFVEQKPLAIYLSLLVSQLGHSIPQICHRGFDQLKLLLNDYRHSKVIRCLELITPLFLGCQESLFNCDNFMVILGSLLTADKTYVKMAKEVMTADSRGPVITFMGNMIQTQLMNYGKYGLKSPADLILLWIRCFTKVPNWNKDQGVVYLLDVIFQVAYQFPDAWYYTRQHFRPLIVKVTDTKIPKSSGLLNLITAEEKDCLIIPPSGELWLSLLFLELEFENIEINTGVWSELMCELILQNRSSLSNALKKVLVLKQIPSFPVQNLVIFKLAKLITKSSPKHFLFPIICQQFFNIYLWRVPAEVSRDVFGMQDKFYDNDLNLMKKVKTVLSDTDRYYNAISLKESDKFKTQFYSDCSKLFKSFLLWLEDNKLNKMTQQHIILPPQYDIEKLKTIFQGNREHWTSFILLQEIRESQKHNMNSWLALIFRYTPVKIVPVYGADDGTKDTTEMVKARIFERLKMYSTPQLPPSLSKKKPFIGQIDVSKSTLFLLRTESKILSSFAKEFNLKVSEHNALDGNYKDAVRLLYVNETAHQVKSVECSKVFEQCQGAAIVKIEISQKRVKEHIKTKLKDNRDRHNLLLENEKMPPNRKIIDADFTLQNIISQLLEQYEEYQRENDKEKCDAILKIGSSFFYDILKEINEDIQACPVTQDLYSVSISQLGMFVQQNHCAEGLNLLKLALQRPNLVNLISELFIPSVSAPQYFLEMYKCLVDSYAKRCDPQLIFVLLSKFDIQKWLQLQKPKMIDISNLIQLILRGLELWNFQNSELLQDLLRCHLMNLFDYHFPEHYGEILQSVLVGFAHQRLKPNVLLDLVNSFYHKVGCQKLEIDAPTSRIKDDFRGFAAKQNVLLYNDVHATTVMLAQQFYTERLQHGLHGLYPKYSEYCDVISLLLGSIGHSVVSAAIHAYPGMMADQLINWLWPCLSEMFSPWLVPYYSHNLKDAPANWIQQFTNTNSALQPWSNVHVDASQKILTVFSMCLQYLLDMLPASNLMLSHLFCWYETSYAVKTTPKHVLLPVHSLLKKMPWERFRPAPIHIEIFNRILMDFIPDSHLFIGNVFLRISWTPWLQQNCHSWDFATLQKMLAILLMIFVKLSYEPKVRESIRILQLLQDAVAYPWQFLEFKDVESVLDWFVMSTESSVILKIPSEHETIDSHVLTLLQAASGMTDKIPDSVNIQQSVLQAKRIAYVRSIVRLLKGCDGKLHQLLGTKQGQQMFYVAIRSLLNSIESCFPQSDVKQTNDVTNLLIPIISGMGLPESISKLFSESIGLWQATSQTGNIVLCCTLNALGFAKSYPLSVCYLMESTLTNYMKISEISPHHNPSWTDARARIGGKAPEMDQQMLINNDLFLSLNLVSYMKLSAMKDDCDKVTYLQALQLALASRKTTEATEAKMALIWGLVIICGGQIMKRSNHSTNQLLIIARYFQVCAVPSEGWGEGLLGAIGLKKEGQTNKKKVLTRCLSCVIFSLFSGDSNTVQQSQEYDSAMTELKNLLSNKKFADVRMVGLQAISLIESRTLDMLDKLTETVTNLIRMFYSDNFLTSIEFFYSI